MPIDEAKILSKLADHHARIGSNTKDIDEIKTEAKDMRKAIERRVPVFIAGTLVAMGSIIGWLGNIVWSS